MESFPYNTDCGAIQGLPRRNIWSADNPVEVLKERLLLLPLCDAQTKAIHVHNKHNLWLDDQCKCAFDLKQEVHIWLTGDYSLVNWEEFLGCQVSATETYSEGGQASV